jgi:hypothetical protein
LGYRGSVAIRTSDGTAGAAAWELIAPATRSISVQEVLVVLAAATASTFGLGRPAAKGVTPTTPVVLLDERGSDGPLATRVAVAWATGPTVPTQFYRRTSLPGTISAFQLWTFPNGLIVPAGLSLVVWNIGTNGVADVHAVVQE